MSPEERRIGREVRELTKRAGAQLAGRARGPDSHVRRNSYDVDDPRAQVWRPINGGTRGGGLRWRDALVRTAKEFDLVGKKPGERGPLTPYGVRVLEVIVKVVDFASGRLEPTIAWIEAQTGFARATVVRALARLATHGFLRWMRRTRKTEGEEGPVRKQTSNAYYFEPSAMPRAVWRYFKNLLSRGEAAAAARTGAGTVSGSPPAPRPPASSSLEEALARLGTKLGMSPSP